MNCLVTGGAGFIGSNLSIALQNLGHEVTVIDNVSSGNKNNLADFRGKIIQCDVAHPFSLEGHYDVIFHQAAITDTTFPDDKEMLRQNVDGFRNILAHALKFKSKLIYASSAGVYGDGPSPMRETQESRPLNAYAQSKLEIDRIAVLHYGKLQIIGLRYFNVFGPGEQYKGTSASMIWQLAQQIKAGKNPRIFKYGKQKRDHIYVKDVVKANLCALDAKAGGIFNVGTGIGTSFNELISSINEALGTDKKPEYFDNPYAGKYQDMTCADMTQSKKILGFTPDYTVHDGILEYIGELK